MFSCTVMVRKERIVLKDRVPPGACSGGRPLDFLLAPVEVDFRCPPEVAPLDTSR